MSYLYNIVQVLSYALGLRAEREIVRIIKDYWNFDNSTRRTITQIRHSSRTEVQRHFVVSEGATLRLGSNITLAGRGGGNRGGVSSLHYFCWQGLLTKIR